MRIAIAGANGRMGRMLVEAVINHPELSLAAALCLPGADEEERDAADFLGMKSGVTISSDLSVLAHADCLIDFTRPEGTLNHLTACQSHGVKMVIGTTGFSAEQLATLEAAASEIAILFSPNMSIGVNALYLLLEKAAQLFNDDYDVEVFEAHHRNKVDAPSGTALKMAEVVAQAKGRDLDKIADWARHGVTGVREKGRIGFSVFRGGDVIGDHTVSFAGPGERIELTHKATNRTIYASGSIQAALFLRDKNKGFYSMRDLMV